MTAAKTRSQLGRMSRNKGAQAERDLVAYLRMVGFGGAERAVRTGYRTASRVSADPGDITGTPGIVWSVKDVSAERVDTWLAELDAVVGEPDAVRLLVHKRKGHAIPDKWWCWLRFRTLLALDGHERLSLPYSAPVRMELGHVVDFLHAAGYGDPTEETT